MEIQKYSTLTCPNCGHQKSEEMPPMAVSFFTNVKTVKPYCAQNPAIVVFIVRMEL